MKKVSIIVPTFKPTDYLFKCLNALAEQDLDCSIWEVLVVLNGPKHPYYSQINKYISNGNHSNFHLIYLNEVGVSLARNKGLEIAKGSYIAFIDDDDLVSSNYLKSLYTLSRADRITCSNFLTFTDNLDSLGSDYLTKAYIKSKSKGNTSILSNRSFFSTATGKLIPKNIISDNKFNTNFHIGEDALFLASISNQIKSVILSPSNVIYYRRIRPTSASQIKRGLVFEIKQWLKISAKYSKIYLSAPFNYNIIFFMTRHLAVLKSLIYRIKKILLKIQ